MYVHIKWHLLTAIQNKCELVFHKKIVSLAFTMCSVLSKTRKPDSLHHWNPFETVQTRTLDKNKLLVKRGRVNRISQMLIECLEIFIKEQDNLLLFLLLSCVLSNWWRSPESTINIYKLNKCNMVNLANNLKLLSEALYDLYKYNMISYNII